MTVEPEPNYLHITVRGKNSPANVRDYLSEVREKCVEHRCFNVLIEENLEGPGLRTFAIFDVIKKASKKVHPLSLHIAYIDVNPEHDSKQLKFAENVAVNRGVDVRVFTDIAEATNWLTALS